MKHFCSVDEAVGEIKKGRMLILVDGPEREDEADFYIPADAATMEALRIMIKEGGGIVCMAMTGARARRLRLPLILPQRRNTEKTGVAFTIPFDAEHGITTGVSAHDRAATIRLAARKQAEASDFVRPGHVFGLIAREGGLRERPGHTEAAVELARLAGRTPMGVLCEIVGEDGRMAERPELKRLARRLGIKMLAMRDLVKHATSIRE